jgi:hypothetical protein
VHSRAMLELISLLVSADECPGPESF